MINEAGITVLRQVPAEYWAGIASNLYSVHGGVIRDQAGRILAHLAMPAISAPLQLVPGLNLIPELIQSYQLSVLDENVLRAVSWSMASTAVSGLGLATSLVSVVYLAKRISQIDGRIAEVKDWLKSASEGQLHAALADLTHASKTADAQTRRQLMLSAKTSFAALAHHYCSQAKSATKLQEVEIFEDYAATAMLGAVLCASDLGLHDAAHDDMRMYQEDWSSMARAQTRRILDLEDAVRLLDGRYVNVLPTSALISVLDFAHHTAKGLDWIDELRTAYGRTTALTSGIRTIAEPAIRYARKLKARQDVLDGYCSHFEFLAAKRLSSSSFASLADSELKGHVGLALILNSGATAEPILAAT